MFIFGFSSTTMGAMGVCDGVEITTPRNTFIGSNPFVMAGLLISGVVSPNCFLNFAITAFGMEGEVSDSLSHCSRTFFNNISAGHLS